MSAVINGQGDRRFPRKKAEQSPDNKHIRKVRKGNAHAKKRMRARSFAQRAHVNYKKRIKIRLTFHFLQKK